MLRRSVVSLAGGVTLGVALPALGQTPMKVFRLGSVVEGRSVDPTPVSKANQDAQRELGWEEGRNFVSERLFTEGRPDRIPSLFAELVAKKVDSVLEAGLSIASIVYGALLGVFLLSRVEPTTPLWDLSLRMALTGFGLGPGQSLFSLAVQNAVPASQIGVVTSANQFFRQIGSTLGVAVFGTLLTHNLTKALGAQGSTLDIGALEGMALKAQAAGASAGVDPALRATISHAITGGFAASLLVIFAGLVVVLFIPELPMRSRQVPGEPVLADEATPTEA